MKFAEAWKESVSCMASSVQVFEKMISIRKTNVEVTMEINSLGSTQRLPRLAGLTFVEIRNFVMKL